MKELCTEETLGGKSEAILVGTLQRIPEIPQEKFLEELLEKFPVKFLDIIPLKIVVAFSTKLLNDLPVKHLEECSADS